MAPPFSNRQSNLRSAAHWLQRRGYEIALLLHDFTAEQAAVA